MTRCAKTQPLMNAAATVCAAMLGNGMASGYLEKRSIMVKYLYLLLPSEDEIQVI